MMPPEVVVIAIMCAGFQADARANALADALAGGRRPRRARDPRDADRAALTTGRTAFLR